MLLGTKTELLTWLRKGNQLYVLPYDYNMRQQATPEQAYEKLRERIAQCQWLGKGIRPWNITPAKDKLDATKVWCGFEFETGYNSQAALHAAIKWFDKTISRGVYDQEGSGSHPIEFTFYPVHLEDIEQKSGVLKMIRRANRKGCAPAWHVPHRRIGTHLNMSTPRMRAGFYIHAEILRAAMQELVPEDHMILFGRDTPAMGEMLYCHGQERYEFKIFNTTYCPVQWKRYCAVSRKLAEVVLWMEDHKNDLLDQQRAYCDAKLQEAKAEVLAIPLPKYSARRLKELAMRAKLAEKECVDARQRGRRVMEPPLALPAVGVAA